MKNQISTNVKRISEVIQKQKLENLLREIRVLVYMGSNDGYQKNKKKKVVTNSKETIV